MLKKLIKALLKGKVHSKHHYSSSDYKKRHYGHKSSKYGHQFYKKKHRSSGFFKSYSSS